VAQYGPDVGAALDWVHGFSCVNDVLQRLDRASAQCLDRHRAPPLTEES
jgi:hypothetical protein